MKGKLIVIEGTDCSGKETQTKLLMEEMKKEGQKVEKFSFPMYDTPTGKIIGGPYLGKSYICDGWFSEGATNVDPKVASLYYAADRVYNIKKITDLLDNGVNVILDRYVYSNMAHQGGKLSKKESREEMYNLLSTLEFGLLNLPVPDIRIFLHLPYEGSCILRQSRSKTEALDQHEMSEEHLKLAETAYVEIAEKFDFKTIECMEKDRIKAIYEISIEMIDFVGGKIINNEHQKVR